MKQQRAPYAIVSDETWELVRAAYLSGLSGSVVAARFGVTLWGLRKRAGREGWTKRDYAQARRSNTAAPEAEGEPAEQAAPALERPELHEVMIAAMAHAGRALMNGDGTEAQAVVRAAEGYLRLSEVIRTEGADRAPKPDPTVEFLAARMPQRFAEFLAWHERTAHSPIEVEPAGAYDDEAQGRP